MCRTFWFMHDAHGTLNNMHICSKMTCVAAAACLFVSTQSAGHTRPVPQHRGIHGGHQCQLPAEEAGQVQDVKDTLLLASARSVAAQQLLGEEVVQPHHGRVCGVVCA